MTAEFVAFASHCVAGVKMPRVIMDKLWEHHVRLPPPSEQRRIVELLDEVDTLRRKRDVQREFEPAANRHTLRSKFNVL